MSVGIQFRSGQASGRISLWPKWQVWILHVTSVLTSDKYAAWYLDKWQTASVQIQSENVQLFERVSTVVIHVEITKTTDRHTSHMSCNFMTQICKPWDGQSENVQLSERVSTVVM